MYLYVPRSKLGHVCYTTPSSSFHSSTYSSPSFPFFFLPIFLFPCRSSHPPVLVLFIFFFPLSSLPFSSLPLSSLLSFLFIPTLHLSSLLSPLTPPLFSFQSSCSSLIPSGPFITFVPLIPSLSSLSLSILSRTSQSCSHLMHPLSQTAYE